MIRNLLIAAFVAALVPSAVMAQPAPVPQAASGRAAYAPFEPLVGRTMRGTSIRDGKTVDIQRWEWAIGGHAVRIVHSVNDGAYAGETLIFRDRDSGDYIFHYFTTGGFHTTGTIRPTGPGAFAIEETVHGVAGLKSLRSTGTLGADGVYRTRGSVEKDGKWVEVGGFDYREDATAVPVMPAQ